MGVGRARGPEGLRGAIGTRGVGSGGRGCCGPGVAMGYPALHVAQQQFVPADPQEDVLTPHLPLRLQLPQVFPRSSSAPPPDGSVGNGGLRGGRCARLSRCQDPAAPNPLMLNRTWQRAKPEVAFSCLVNT